MEEGNEDYKNKINEQRKEKDYFFKHAPDSPIPFEEREKFSGLIYYPVEPSLRFVLKLHEHKEKKKIRIQDTGENMREYLIWGEFRFVISGKEFVLQAFKADSEDDTLWVPFKDETNGKETYGAGRYIDIHESTKTEKGEYILDFNLAYNPWCAYSENYVCPFIPPENWLKTEIRAGEKSYEVNSDEN
ncbi:MAG: DUF1684 domain-containing protein [Candidatus Micrarchaeota archaeon]|nr:DUF1684 domain-containing protein [Candidatus Micrarchaeota archaeon]